ncbi:LPXTG cell wall anchor domain-containing protein, partial [Veillonella parvula]
DKTTPQTGDRTNAALLFGCAVLSGAGVFFAYRRRRTIK